MTFALRLRLLRIGLTLILAVALTVLGTAHRIPNAKDQSLAAYALAGGPVSVICGDAGDQGSGEAAGDCPACHLAGGVVLPDPVMTIRDAELRFVAEVVAPRVSRAVRPARDLAHGLRAPPVA